MKKSKILVCDPSHYCINYEINPWMNRSNNAEKNISFEQWALLIDKLKRLGVDVVNINPVENLPDMVFTANSGVLLNNSVLLSNFKFKERQQEKQYFKNWFLNYGYRIIELPDGICFEGAGDCLVKDDVVFMGHGFRTDKEAYNDIIWDGYFDLQYNAFKIKLINPYFYHLDTCFCPLNKNQILLYPGAIDKNDLLSLRKRFEILSVAEEDAKKFACNAILIDDNIIIPKGCDETKDILTQNYYIVHELEMSEFIKAGGACKCLTVEI